MTPIMRRALANTLAKTQDGISSVNAWPHPSKVATPTWSHPLRREVEQVDKTWVHTDLWEGEGGREGGREGVRVGVRGRQNIDTRYSQAHIPAHPQLEAHFKAVVPGLRYNPGAALSSLVDLPAQLSNWPG